MRKSSQHDKFFDVHKKKKIDDTNINIKEFNNEVQNFPEMIHSNAYIGDETQPQEIEKLDLNEIKKLISSFEKKISKNRELRIKFPEQPEKFIDSECELFEELQSLHTVTCSPHFFKNLIEFKLMSNLLELVCHDNNDIRAAALELIFETIDPETVTESEQLTLMTDHLVDQNFYEITIAYLNKLELADSESHAHLTVGLTIIETLVEYKPNIASLPITKSILSWILTLLATAQYQPVYLHIVEIFTILLQNSEENREYIGTCNGVDKILICLSQYRKSDPRTSDEVEYMQNLFDCACALLLSIENRNIFIKCEGMELMILLMRSKRIAKCGALKVLSFLIAPECESEQFIKFIECSGLKGLFPMFLFPPKFSKRVGISIDDIEEYCCSIIFSLFKHLKGEWRDRIIGKFVEDNLIKVDRLMELFLKYNHKDTIANKKIDVRRRELDKQNRLIDDEMEDQFYFDRLEVGLFTLQHITCIICDLISQEIPQITQKISIFLSQRQISHDLFSDILKEYIEHYGEKEHFDHIVNEKIRLEGLLKILAPI